MAVSNVGGAIAKHREKRLAAKRFAPNSHRVLSFGRPRFAAHLYFMRLRLACFSQFFLNVPTPPKNLS